ncbi:MAG TPA: single-stranded-DNA-specific exonuclease RecJ, partial [Myxococcales bacterium]|nr:single-stranded-DNA-specific exonuclease RecJ [Myxococcales bacterium]
MRWQLGEGTGRDAVQQGARLASVLGIPAPVGRVLWARGYREASQAERFLEPRFEHLPNPFELKGIEVAVSRLQSALAQGEHVCVYGDYDVDG